jgi:chromosome condensin MukBEF ATPase and DNA-binding subunit MukB
MICSQDSSLRDREHTLERTKEELHREFEKKLEDARDASRRLRTDVEHEIELQKRRAGDLETLLTQAQQDRSAASSQYRKLEADFVEYRQHVASTPVARLQEVCYATLLRFACRHRMAF